MAQHHSNNYCYGQEQHSSASHRHEIYVLIPRAAYFWDGEPPRPPKLRCIPSTHDIQVNGHSIDHTLAKSSPSEQPFLRYLQGSVVAEFWESQTGSQDPVPIYESRFGHVTPVHEYLPNMASDDSRLISVREEVVSEALTFLTQNPNMSIGDCYRSAVRNFLSRSVEASILDLVTRVDLEVEFALNITRATKRRDKFTPKQMDNLHALGKSFVEMATLYHSVWLEEVTRLSLWLDTHAIVIDADQYHQYIGGRRNWETKWATSTLKGSGAKVGASINPPYYGNANRGDNAREEVGVKDVSMLDIVEPALSAPKHPITTTHENNTSPGDNGCPLCVHEDADGIISWSKVINGLVVPFAQYQHGNQRPWKCLLCDRCLVNEKGSLQGHLRHQHGLTGLKQMRVSNENYSNFQGHDNNDCYMWGEYVKNDPLPWKCLLCVDHRGVKIGRKTFARHFQKTHGIKVILPPVTPADIQRHRQKKEQTAIFKRSLDNAFDNDGGDKDMDNHEYEDDSDHI